MKFYCVFLFITMFLTIRAFPRTAYYDDINMHSSHSINKRDLPDYFLTADENTESYWIDIGQTKLLQQLNKEEIKKKAKNVILFLGDGMSIPTLAAARAYLGQQVGKPGEETKLSFEEFPFTGLSKTYCVDRQVADSACSATAYLCGVKANYGTIGVTAAVKRDQCTPMNNHTNHVHSILRWSQLAGKSTGVVTTTRITHASPAGAFAHTAERDWESDKDVESAGLNATECLDIAQQLVYSETGRNFNVILGGGRVKFLPKEVTDEENQFGERLDGVNLIEEWKKLRLASGQIGEYVWNKNELLNVNEDTNYLFGLFESDHLQYHLDADEETEPTLAEMTEVALKILSKNPEGYFLFVEGGRIDHAHHATKAQKALDETLQFAEAVKLAAELTDRQETLIVVTSDHAHTMSLSGYPTRGNDIFGIAGTSTLDNMTYSTLSYANGPGYKIMDQNGTRHDLGDDNMDDKEYEFPSLFPLDAETHGGDDVGIYALGPWAHLFVGVMEQNVIPHIMAYASCVGNGLTSCDKKTK